MAIKTWISLPPTVHLTPFKQTPPVYGMHSTQFKRFPQQFKKTFAFLSHLPGPYHPPQLSKQPKSACHATVWKHIVTCKMQSVTSAIFGTDFLKWYDPQISWVDYPVVMPCLATNYTVFQSSTNVLAGSVACSRHVGMNISINGASYKN